MAIIIQDLLPNSLALQHKLVPGSKLLSINGHLIRDFLDLEFYGAEEELLLEVEAPGERACTIKITREPGRCLGIEPEDYRVRECHNSCIFCFIDQMPPHLRESLYGKDDDYLYSFVFGNYITLTNLTENDYHRILSQHINPLYISLHTTDSKLRKQMMRYADSFDVMQALRRLSKGGISFHLQIVCVPGFNDSQALADTLEELLTSKLDILSIGIVPVGLTRFRQGLSELKPFDQQGAVELIELVEKTRARHGSSLIYPADEFYVLARQAIPEADFYEDYPQLENGIGMLRLSLDSFRRRKRSLLKELRKTTGNFLFATSISAAETLEQIASELNQRLEGQIVRVQPIRNDFFGELITVSGLLTNQDLARQLQPAANDVIVLPSNMFNHDSLTLDGADYATLKATWPNRILVIDQFFEDWDYL